MEYSVQSFETLFKTEKSLKFAFKTQNASTNLGLNFP